MATVPLCSLGSSRASMRPRRLSACSSSTSSASARSVKMPLTEAVGDSDQRRHLIELRAQVQALSRFTDDVVAPELGLSKGFNATDGD